ncbi:MAG: MFS transporter, partial [Alcanivoracaceae bacterium]|nr:MFS transporter [Alcanivoracaceae bacterium]
MSGFNPTEKKAAFSIAILIALRMYGLFLIMPVFSVYAKTLPYSTPLLIGLALGIYGLTQALLQIPLGLASDFFGRKKILTIGLLIFIVGSIIAALSTNIYSVIIGRAIQGMGAIASTGMALIADVSRPEQR